MSYALTSFATAKMVKSPLDCVVGTLFMQHFIFKREEKEIYEATKQSSLQNLIELTQDFSPYTLVSARSIIGKDMPLFAQIFTKHH